MNERSLIADVATKHASRYAVVALNGEEPIGAQRLRQLANADLRPVSVRD